MGHPLLSSLAMRRSAANLVLDGAPANQAIFDVSLRPLPEGVVVRFRTAFVNLPVVEIFRAPGTDTSDLTGANLVASASVWGIEVLWQRYEATFRGLDQDTNYWCRISLSPWPAKGPLIRHRDLFRTLQRDCSVWTHSITILDDSDDLSDGEFYFFATVFDARTRRRLTKSRVSPETGTLTLGDDPPAHVSDPFRGPFQLTKAPDDIVVVVRAIDDDEGPLCGPDLFGRGLGDTLEEAPGHERTCQDDWSDAWLPMSLPDSPGTYHLPMAAYSPQHPPGFHVSGAVDVTITSHPIVRKSRAVHAPQITTAGLRQRSVPSLLGFGQNRSKLALLPDGQFQRIGDLRRGGGATTLSKGGLLQVRLLMAGDDQFLIAALDADRRVLTAAMTETSTGPLAWRHVDAHAEGELVFLSGPGPTGALFLRDSKGMLLTLAVGPGGRAGETREIGGPFTGDPIVGELGPTGRLIGAQNEGGEFAIARLREDLPPAWQTVDVGPIAPLSFVADPELGEWLVGREPEGALFAAHLRPDGLPDATGFQFLGTLDDALYETVEEAGASREPVTSAPLHSPIAVEAGGGIADSLARPRRTPIRRA